MAVNYLDAIARQIKRRISRADLPEQDTHDLFRIYAVLLLAKGSLVEPEDVHNAWVAWMLPIDPTHKSLVPFSQLDSKTAANDEPYVNAIKSLAIEGDFCGG